MLNYSVANITEVALIIEVTSDPTVISSSLTASKEIVAETLLRPATSTTTIALTAPWLTLITFPAN